MMKLRALLITSAAAAAMTTPVLAQDAPSAPSTPEQATSPTNPAPLVVSGEIIVTAQKREQRLIDVPQSVSVISSSLLQATHAERLEDYFNRIPSAAINQSQPGQGRIILRGINTGGVGATVATYVDETPLGSATSLSNGAQLAPDIDPSELDRIEVLRGPQGTLYGANSLGGLIKYVTVAPSTDAVHGSAQVGVESLEHGGTGWSERAALNLPVTDTLAVRGSGFYRKDAGFIDDPVHGRDVDSAKSYGGRVSILFKPTPDLILRGTAVLQNLESNAMSTYEADPVTLAPTLGRYVQNHVVSTPSDVNYRVYNFTGSYDFGPVTLLSTTSWGNLVQNAVQDYTSLLGAPGRIDQFVSQKRFTQEIRLTSSQPSKVEWTVGGFYTREHDRIGQSVGLNDAAGVPIAGTEGLQTVAVPERYREIAGFGSATVHFGERFDLTLGGRYSNNKQNSSQTIAGQIVPEPIVYAGTSSDNVFTFSVAPSFKPTQNTTIYARVARGYRPGGPNVLPPSVPANIPKTFGADRTTNYEVGIKSELLDRMLSVELTGFWIDWKDIQLITGVEGFGVNVNGGKARSKGIEFSATLTPVEGLTFSANGAYIDAKLREDVAALPASSGDRLPYTARFAGTLSADYSRPLTDAINGTVGASWRYTGKRDSGFESTYGQQRLGSFSQVDAHAGVTYGHFRLDGFVRNITDSHGILDVGGLGSSSDLAAISVAIVRPRTYGATLGFTY